MHWSEFAYDIDVARQIVADESLDEIEANAREAAILFTHAGLTDISELHLFYLLYGVKRVRDLVMGLTEDMLRGTDNECLIALLPEAQAAVADSLATYIYVLYSYLPDSAKIGNYQPVGIRATANSIDWSDYLPFVREAVEMLRRRGKQYVAMLATEDQLATKWRQEFAAFDDTRSRELCLCYLIGVHAMAGEILHSDEVSEAAGMMVFQLALVCVMRLLPYLPLELTGWTAP